MRHYGRKSSLVSKRKPRTEKHIEHYYLAGEHYKFEVSRKGVGFWYVKTKNGWRRVTGRFNRTRLALNKIRHEERVAHREERDPLYKHRNMFSNPVRWWRI